MKPPFCFFFFVSGCVTNAERSWRVWARLFIVDISFTILLSWRNYTNCFKPEHKHLTQLSLTNTGCHVTDLMHVTQLVTTFTIFSILPKNYLVFWYSLHRYQYKLTFPKGESFWQTWEAKECVITSANFECWTQYLKMLRIVSFREVIILRYDLEIRTDLLFTMATRVY